MRYVVTDGLNFVSAEGIYSTCWSQKEELEMWGLMDSIPSVQREIIVHADLKKEIRDVVTNGLNSVSAEGKYSTCWSQKEKLEIW